MSGVKGLCHPNVTPATNLLIVCSQMLCPARVICTCKHARSCRGQTASCIKAAKLTSSIWSVNSFPKARSCMRTGNVDRGGQGAVGTGVVVGLDASLLQPERNMPEASLPKVLLLSNILALLTQLIATLGTCVLGTPAWGADPHRWQHRLWSLLLLNHKVCCFEDLHPLHLLNMRACKNFKLSDCSTDCCSPACCTMPAHTLMPDCV